MASLPTKEEGTLSSADETVAGTLPSNKTHQQHGVHGAAKASD